MRFSVHTMAAVSAVLLSGAVLLSACGKSAAETPSVSPSAAVPTEAATDTPAPTAAPTEAPTPTPTAEPTETPAPTPEPTDTPSPEPSATAIPDSVPGGAGTYSYRSDAGEWTLTLKDTGPFTLKDPDGGLHTGESWEVQPDGTVICGPTDIYTASFAFDGGCSHWYFMRGNLCAPLNER